MSSAGATAPLAAGGTIPLLGFGTWQLRGDEAYRAILAALEVGYRHLDTATGYGNEREVGRALRDSGLPRDEVFVTTKLPPDRAGRERETLDRSLEDLGLEQVDLWLIHWPPKGAGVPVWEQFLAARDSGRARHIGVSNYSTAQLDELQAATGELPAVNQIRWSPQVYDAERLAEHRQRDVVLEGYSPFRAGWLEDPDLVEIAAAHEVTPAQVILRWHLETGVVAIPKSAQPARIAANFDVFDFTLSGPEVEQISSIAG